MENKMEFLLTKSKNKTKKFDITIKQKGKRSKTISFGAQGYDDYTTHQDQSRKDKYILRHKENEDWSNYKTAGFWSKNLLWNQTTLQDSINNTQDKFKIKISQDL